MTQPSGAETPRYPLFDPEATYDDRDEPLYYEQFCGCGGILRIRARAYQMPGALEGFQARHGKPACKPIGRAEWPAARAAEQKRGALQAVLNEAIADGADADEITARVAKADKAFQPRGLNNFNADATPEV